MIHTKLAFVRRGLTLLQLLVAVTVLGTIAAVLLSRIGRYAAPGRKSACDVNQRHIEIQVETWRRNKGVWPANNLSDIGANATYFPGGLPTCPVDGSAYALDATTHRVTGHTH